LHLGQTQEQIIAILGLPTSHSRNLQNHRDDLTYSLEVKKKTTPRELAQRFKLEQQHNPGFSMNDIQEEWKSYGLEVYIHAVFINDALTNLTVSWSAQN
jgi:hypothetical protein